jgi:metal-responsive CopG/Arc/MetJ family transcriptional regulator
MRVSIPDDVAASAEQLAERDKKSLDEVCADAVREYVQRHDSDQWVTDAMNRAIAEIGDEPDEFVSEAARRTLESR